jgi:hypothetical protein
MTLSFFEDVEFDDGPATEVHPPSRGRRGRRGGGGGGDERPPGGSRPDSSGKRRLLVAAVAIVIVLIVGWYWIRSCQADAQRRAYENYVTDVNAVVKQSDDIGDKLDNALLDPTATKKTLVATVAKLAQNQAEVAASAAKLHDTGKLRGLQAWLDTTMTYRTQGLEGMSAALSTALSKDPVLISDVQQVSDAYERLLASDVLYSDSFERPGTQALAKANVTGGVHLSDSTFALTPKYVVAADLRQLLVRAAANGSSSTTGTGGSQAVGTKLQKVVALPSLKKLVPDGITSIPLANATFKVYVENSGDVVVTKLKVRFVEGGHPQVHTIKSIEPNGVAFVLFTPKFATAGIPATIKVTAVPVAHETNSGNNSATYRVEYGL